MKHILIGASLALALVADASAQQSNPHQGHGMATAASESAATRAYRDVNAGMHRNMDIGYSGDPDIDFVRAMIPHHQGAIDMAKIVLRHGKDPFARKLAEDVVKAQESEIAAMRDWLRKKGVN